MKYIRTKDGIIDLTTLPNLDIDNMSNITWYNDTEKYGYMIEYEDIIKQADTIEELCDTKVAIRKSNHKAYLGHLSGIFMFQEDGGWLGRLDSYEIIYGAIWTDKGLIYKAKMKGILSNGGIDWELL